MLRALSGREHCVCTGHCLVDAATGRRRAALAQGRVESSEGRELLAAAGHGQRADVAPRQAAGTLAAQGQAAGTPAVRGPDHDDARPHGAAGMSH